MLPNYVLDFTSLQEKTRLEYIITVTRKLTVWTEAAFSASVRMEWESGPIRRNLFISIVKSLKERESLRVGTSLRATRGLWHRPNRGGLRRKGPGRLQPAPDHNACGCRDPRIGLMWISSSIPEKLFNWFSIFSTIFPFSLLANFLIGQCRLALVVGRSRKGVGAAGGRCDGFCALTRCFYFL